MDYKSNCLFQDKQKLEQNLNWGTTEVLYIIE